MKKLFFAIVLLVFTASLYSQGQPFTVAPVDVDPGYDSTNADHYLVYNSTTQRNKLLLWMGGTYSNPNLYFRICRFAGDLGFHVISLSYLNDVPVAPLGNDPDSTVFERFRQEICFGTPVSNEVTVDSLNSIYTRTIKLLQYLDANQPAENWGQFLVGADSLDWPNIIVGGHSQGAGHAPYLAKRFPVERSLSFSGPNDYSTLYNRGAPWFSWPGVTPASAHFAYLHFQDDVVDFFKQYANLGRLGLSDSTLVDPISPPYNNAHFLYTDQPNLPFVGYHSMPISQTATNELVWEYMLTSAVPVGVGDGLEGGYGDLNSFDAGFLVYPVPASGNLYIEALQPDMLINAVSVYDVRGKMVLSQTVDKNTLLKVDLRTVSDGVYWIRIDTATGLKWEKIQVLKE